ncbi:hypothetical protein BGX26_005228, partial [Mortierella sp. AD094]
MVSPSSPISPLPPPTSSVSLSPAASSSTPHTANTSKPRSLPPTLPPTRAHGVHARTLARPPSTILPTSPTSPAVTSNHSPISGEPVYPAPALQTPQQAHQPRQRQAASSVRSAESTIHNRPAPPPARLSSNISVPCSQPSIQDKAEQQSTTKSTESIKSTTQDLGSHHSAPGPDPEKEDEEEDEDDIMRVEGEKTKKIKPKKVRKSIEKLARLSIEKKRISRQLKALTSASVAQPSTTTIATLNAETAALTPKRRSLWASLFGNGNTEAKPTLADSLVRGNGSTQSLGALTVESDESHKKSDSAPVPDSPVSTKSENSFSDKSAHSSHGSRSAEMETSAEKFLPGESGIESSSNSSPDQDDVLAVNVVRHERSRTLPGILPQWDGSILWSLTRALSTKKSTVKPPPPLESDSSDSDISVDTGDDEQDAFEDSNKDFEDFEDSDQMKSSTLQPDNIPEPMADPEEKIPSLSPCVPARVALSNRTHAPKERVMVTEAQVQIGEDLDDENPFTDSHALPATYQSSGPFITPKSQNSVSSSSQGSSNSPSLSPLSYLTGSSASGSTWSLQGSRTSLMKMIFKSKNETTPTGGMDATGNSDIYAELSYRTAESSSGSTGPSTPLQSPKVDLFSDFESTGVTDVSMDVQTKSIKRRSFVTPGAFPGDERASLDEVPYLDSGFVPTHVPMYAASENDNLAVAQHDKGNRHHSKSGGDSVEVISDKHSYDSDSSDTDQDVINAQPFHGSYERTSHLKEPPLPRFATGLSVSNQQHQLGTDAKDGGVHLDSEHLHIEVHPTTVTSTAPVYRSPKQKARGAYNAMPDVAASSKQEKSSPSILAIAQAPGTASTSLSLQKTTPSSTTPPSIDTTESSYAQGKRQDSSSGQMSRKRSSGPTVLNNANDRLPSKEELIEFSSRASKSNWDNMQGLQVSRGKLTAGAGYADVGVSSRASEDSPLVVEVISSGLRSSGNRERSIPSSPHSAVAAKQEIGSAMQSAAPHASQLHQFQGRANPPPLPPPRNARRPRSKTLSRHASMDITRISIDRLSSSPTTDEPQITRVDASASTSVLTREYGAPYATSNEVPAKEHIMEEMGSEQAQTFNEEDYLYCQNQQNLRSNASMPPESQSNRSQGYAQPYGKGNSAFDSYPSFAEQQQQQRGQQAQSTSWNFQQSETSSATPSDAHLVATLREQIASLSTERDQFYNEAMLLRRKHEMLTNIVNHM